jgi:hypothetical protein
MTSGYNAELFYDHGVHGIEKKFSVEKTFKFVDIFDNVDSSFCNVTIKVIEKISGGKPIYDISYSYKYSNNESALRANPFFYSKNIQEFDKEGVIVYKNEMTDQMINYLLMDSEELSKKCGMFWVQYKIKIMESLANLWD